MLGNAPLWDTFSSPRHLPLSLLVLAPEYISCNRPGSELCLCSCVRSPWDPEYDVYSSVQEALVFFLSWLTNCPYSSALSLLLIPPPQDLL